MTTPQIQQDLAYAAASGRDHVTIFSAAPGFGKTHAMVHLLSQNPDLSAVILCPTRELAKQTQAQVPGSHLLIDEEKCSRAQEVYDLYHRNIRGRRLVCATCPQGSGCQALSRYRGITKQRIIISTHEQLRWLFPLLVQYEHGPYRERDLVIIDEDPALPLLAPVQHQFDDLVLFAGHLELALGTPVPEIEMLKSSASDPTDEFVAYPSISPRFRFSPSDRAKWLRAISASALSSQVKDMLDFVEGAISKGFVVVKRKGTHRITTPPPKPPVFEHQPSIVILSATPMPDEEYRRMFPNSKVSRRSYSSTEGELHVRHIPYSNLAKGRHVQNELPLKKMLARIVQREGHHKSYALVTSKTYEQLCLTALTEAGADDVRSFHYGALEGLNTAQNADVCMILGVNQRPPEVIVGRYLWDLNLSVPLNGTDFYMLTPEGLAFHDQRFDALNQHIMNSDVLQGLGRTRWVRRTTPTTVYLLSKKDQGLAQRAAAFVVDDDLSQPWIEVQVPGRRSELDAVMSAIIEIMVLSDRCTPAEVAHWANVDKATVNRHLRKPDIRSQLLKHGVLVMTDHQPGKPGRPGTVLVQQDTWEASPLISLVTAPALRPQTAATG